MSTAAPNRAVVVDVETTGLDVQEGDRIVEIACVELLNHVPTGSVYHRYVNPQREVPPEALAVHGLSNEFLEVHPTFAEIADEFLSFIGTDRLVIHNAEFDLGFLNAELMRAGKPKITCQCEDTLEIARRRFPGASASLDALCRRFDIDLSMRTLHGARVDCHLLAKVYLELIGGRQPGLDLVAAAQVTVMLAPGERPIRPPRQHAPTEAELAAHAAFVATLANPIWLADD